jgi:hypothetical protein
MEQDEFAIDQVEKAQEDFTSLGRWGWGLAITFLTAILLKSAESGGNFFPDIRCSKGAELGWPFLGVILIAGGVYGYFIWRARQRVERAIALARSIRGELEQGEASNPALNYTLHNAPGKWTLRFAMGLRYAIIVVLLGTWFALFEVHNIASAMTDADKKACADWVASKQKKS